MSVPSCSPSHPTAVIGRRRQTDVGRRGTATGRSGWPPGQPPAASTRVSHGGDSPAPPAVATCSSLKHALTAGGSGLIASTGTKEWGGPCVANVICGGEDEGRAVGGTHRDAGRRGGMRRAAIRPGELRGGRRIRDSSPLRQKGREGARNGRRARLPRRTAVAWPPRSVSPEGPWRDSSAAAESPHCRQSGRWFRPKPTPWRTSFCDARRLDFPRDRYPSARTLLICLTVVWYYCPTLCGKISQQ